MVAGLDPFNLAVNVGDHQPHLLIATLMGS